MDHQCSSGSATSQSPPSPSMPSNSSQFGDDRDVELDDLSAGELEGQGYDVAGGELALDRDALLVLARRG